MTSSQVSSPAFILRYSLMVMPSSQLNTTYAVLLSPNISTAAFMWLRVRILESTLLSSTNSDRNVLYWGILSGLTFITDEPFSRVQRVSGIYSFIRTLLSVILSNAI